MTEVMPSPKGKGKMIIWISAAAIALVAAIIALCMLLGGDSGYEPKEIPQLYYNAMIENDFDTLVSLAMPEGAVGYRAELRSRMESTESILEDEFGDGDPATKVTMEVTITEEVSLVEKLIADGLQPELAQAMANGRLKMVEEYLLEYNIAVDAEESRVLRGECVVKEDGQVIDTVKDDEFIVTKIDGKWYYLLGL